MAVIKRYRNFQGKRKLCFQAEVYFGGVRVAYETFDTRGAAQAWHDTERAKFTSGRGQDDGWTVADCVRHYDEEAMPLLRRSSQQSRRRRFYLYLDAPLAGVRMAELNTRHIDEWFDWLLVHPTARNPQRKNFLHELRILTVILNWYRGERPEFVVPIVKKHRKKCVFKITPPRRPDYYIRAEDVGRWLSVLEQLAPQAVYHRLARFMVSTGLRLGEAAGMHWDAIDLREGIASVVRTVAWDQDTREPYLQECAKTEESIRIVALAPPTLALLRKMRHESSGMGPVFVNSEGGLLRDTKVRETFNRAFKAAQLPWRATRIARHTFATWALKGARGNIDSVQWGMGHSNRSQTEHYAKVVAQADNAVFAKAAELMGLDQTNHGENHGEASVESEFLN